VPANTPTTAISPARIHCALRQYRQLRVKSKALNRRRCKIVRSEVAAGDQVPGRCFLRGSRGDPTVVGAFGDPVVDEVSDLSSRPSPHRPQARCRPDSWRVLLQLGCRPSLESIDSSCPLSRFWSTIPRGSRASPIAKRLSVPSGCLSHDGHVLEVLPPSKGRYREGNCAFKCGRLRGFRWSGCP